MKDGGLAPSDDARILKCGSKRLANFPVVPKGIDEAADSPAIGLVMSELLLDGRASTVDITAFRASRFAEGQPIRPQFEYAEN